jgi:hypothetical protein
MDLGTAGRSLEVIVVTSMVDHRRLASKVSKRISFFLPRTFGSAQSHGIYYFSPFSDGESGNSLNCILESFYRPRNLFVVGPLLFLTALTLWPTNERKTSGVTNQTNSTSLVRAWLNPHTREWELPAPWDPAFRAYQKKHPDLHFVNRAKVRAGNRRNDRRRS